MLKIFFKVVVYHIFFERKTRTKLYDDEFAFFYALWLFLSEIDVDSFCSQVHKFNYLQNNKTRQQQQ